MKLNWNSLLNALLAAFLIGVGSYLYAATEEIKQLKTEVAVTKSEQDRAKEDIKEIKQDVKEIKQEQAKGTEEVKDLLREVLAAAKNK